MKTLPLMFIAALSLTACDSKQEEARKAAVENQADKLDEAAKTAEKTASGNAEVAKKEGEAAAEALKDQADKVRDQK